MTAIFVDGQRPNKKGAPTRGLDGFFFFVPLFFPTTLRRLHEGD